MNLGRLSVRQKLSLLLLVPLIVLVFLAVPFIADRTSEARAASATATVTRTASEVSALVQEVQRERLLALGYLASPPANRSALVSVAQEVRDRTADLRRSLGTRISAELTAALAKVDGLATIRERVLARATPATDAYRAFGESVSSLLGALGLAARAEVDPSGARGVSALDALLRADEASSQVGAALMVSIVDRDAGPALVAEANAAERLYTERFVALSPATDAALFQTIDASQADKQVDELAAAIRQPQAAADPVGLATAVVGAVDSLAGLQRLVQDGIAQEITDTAAERATGATIAAIITTALSVLLFTVVFGLIVTVSRSIALPLRRLTRAATAVADLANAELVRVSADENADGPAPRLAAIDIGSEDEIGELATAFNRVQATAALLLERQLMTRRNVSTMFANVGRRTQNLVGRQLGLLEELERDETDPKLLAELYRLDHVCTRLRRSAYSLLVVAGSSEESYGAQPVLLANVVRAALGEIEGFQSVRLHGIADVTVTAHLVSDLTLLVAELLENSTSFSPPDELVDVYARSGPDFCRLSIIDHGIGMPAASLAEENRRLVERERLDIAPTSTLGLFVVGRLARRHGLTVRLAPTAERGVTVLIDIPNPLLLGAGAAALPSEEPGPVRARVDSPTPARGIGAASIGAPAEGDAELATPRATPVPELMALNGVELLDIGPVVEFPWFTGPEEDPEDGGEPSTADSAESAERGGAQAEDPDTGDVAVPVRRPSSRPAIGLPAGRSDTAAGERYDVGVPAGHADPPIRVERLNDPPKVEPLTRGGLHRRVPSAQLFDIGNAPPPLGTVVRDPAADRAAMEALEAGTARAARELPTPTRPTPVLRAAGPPGARDSAVRPSSPHARTRQAGPGAGPPGTGQPGAGRPGQRDGSADSAGSAGSARQPGRGGLQRRIPGASLAATLRAAAQPDPTPTASSMARQRNPDAERDSMNAFLDGFAEGAEPMQQDVSTDPGETRRPSEKESER